ncbi:AI-2E family transporter [Undibacterium terreum]|uniref:AI-2E family transporter n=1 Tax=Undibacterium terreum TaxID=1224302 RepID=A0A916UD74_9BURK|nr:AI-2E family transporter [Undibacterium terreum]GGC68042.1 AI-2E family transporter [Undibacterium terreum]
MTEEHMIAAVQQAAAKTQADTRAQEPAFSDSGEESKYFDRDDEKSDFDINQYARGTTASGPFVLLSVIATTCVLLFLFQKLLWLVTPFLLALILYYLLFPFMERLMFLGLSRERAALSVILGFVTVGFLATILFLPRVLMRLSNSQALIGRYVNGAVSLALNTVAALEENFSVLAQAHLSRTLNGRFGHATGTISEIVEPVLMGAATWAPALLLVPLLAFFFLKDGQRFKVFLSRSVPNAFFETTLQLLHEVDRAALAYFRGLIQLTVLDTATLAVGLWVIGMPAPLALGLLSAVLAWVPYIGSVVGGFIVVTVAASAFPTDPTMAYWAAGLFIVLRLLDDFLYMPMTIGKSLRIHPLISVVMIFIGGAVAGIAGLMLVLPVFGIVLVIGETVGLVVTNERLRARYQHGKYLRRRKAHLGLRFGTARKRW